ncbi:hypothetical protein [Actinomadura sp. DC4]|uniref:hypothetical protein n=1 Tax=Actinomadura sp. DC4 TaxID=3055069 RepID=UPI0025B1EA0D|nr:hypothetical protein [Actinomadura sp. DC4]MDN3357819.1 hypothetical protein [Actinomadura sp. DC4]
MRAGLPSPDPAGHGRPQRGGGPPHGRPADGFRPAVADPAPLFAECRRAAPEARRDPGEVTLIAEAAPRSCAMGVSLVLVIRPGCRWASRPPRSPTSPTRSWRPSPPSGDVSLEASRLAGRGHGVDA